MALYVVVHHQRDENQPWVNAWLNDELIDAIQTTTEIPSYCNDILRCGLKGRRSTDTFLQSGRIIVSRNLRLLTLAGLRPNGASVLLVDPLRFDSSECGPNYSKVWFDLMPT
jgi:hypothetical protein